MKAAYQQWQKDLVLVGGGHAHALALRMLAMKPIAGLRITLVSLDSHTPYSGMLPGLIAGHYSFEDAHIDLARLCQWAGVHFIAAKVTGLDPQERRVLFNDRPPLAYDILSLDTGSEPELDSVPGAREHAVPVKPVHQFWQRWRAYSDAADSDSVVGKHVVIVGGGAGGVEIALAMAHATGTSDTRFSLLCGSSQILTGYNRRARAAVERALADHGVALHCGSRVDAVEPGELCLTGGARFSFDQLFWCTAAAPGAWLSDCGLPVDERGFLALRDTLQVVDHDTIFAAGDVGTQLNHPRPKAGVYAVRQGPVLAHNLAAFALGQPLREHRPQQRFLSLVSLGDRSATADRGPFSVTGNWVWRWKNRIDREFMDRFHQLQPMVEAPASQPARALTAPAEQTQMPCGGCGAKVGATALAATLASLAERWPTLSLQPGASDDAAQLEVPAPGLLLQSVDVLRQLVTDPFLMGRIAAQHAMSDIYAMGAQPTSALAIAALPFAHERLLRRELEQLLAGALTEFARCGCRLSGGHSMQAEQLSLGFAVNGVPLHEGIQLGKRGLQPGDQLILTKALGTGVLFAGHMQLAVDGRDLTVALHSMLQSNAGAAQIALRAKAHAVTDITGFGLAGHLREMLDEHLSASIEIGAVPALPGVTPLLNDGVRGSAHATNADALQAALECSALDSSALDEQARRELLFDAQTSGGLLMGVAPDAAQLMLRDLVDAGYEDAAMIGEVTAREGSAQIHLM
ncbi:MAG: selenide, water dikinase SelD [Pseudomonadota bacterium]